MFYSRSYFSFECFLQLFSGIKGDLWSRQVRTKPTTSENENKKRPTHTHTGKKETIRFSRWKYEGEWKPWTKPKYKKRRRGKKRNVSCGELLERDREMVSYFHSHTFSPNQNWGLPISFLLEARRDCGKGGKERSNSDRNAIEILLPRGESSHFSQTHFEILSDRYFYAAFSLDRI